MLKEEGARTIGQGEMSSSPTAEIGYQAPVRRWCKLNERATDLRWKIMNKRDT